MIALSAPRASCLVLVDHRGPFAVVTHPGHEVPQPRAVGCREVVPGVPQIMEVQPIGADGARHVVAGPAGQSDSLLKLLRRIGLPLAPANRSAVGSRGT